jgi:hypothetical protein
MYPPRRKEKNKMFQLLGLPDTSTEQQVLRAWRAMARQYHPDKQSSVEGAEQNDAKMKELNEAKVACLNAILEREYTVDEREFARFVARKLEKSIARNCGVLIDLDDGDLIKRHLRKFMWNHAVDAMDWVIRTAIREYEFDQDTEDEIPVICKFYNDFIGRDHWEEQDHTFMMVLNKYGEIKAGGYGNFGRLIESSLEESACVSSEGMKKKIVF